MYCRCSDNVTNESLSVLQMFISSSLSARADNVMGDTDTVIVFLLMFISCFDRSRQLPVSSEDAFLLVQLVSLWHWEQSELVAAHRVSALLHVSLLSPHCLVTLRGGAAQSESTPRVLAAGEGVCPCVGMGGWVDEGVLLFNWLYVCVCVSHWVSLYFRYQCLLDHAIF